MIDTASLHSAHSATYGRGIGTIDIISIAFGRGQDPIQQGHWLIRSRDSSEIIKPVQGKGTDPSAHIIVEILAEYAMKKAISQNLEC